MSRSLWYLHLVLVPSTFAAFRDQLKWPVYKGKTPYDHIQGRAICFNGSNEYEMSRCEAFCNYDRHWIPMSTLDRVCNKHMKFGVPIGFSLRFSERNAIPWCWLLRSSDDVSYSSIALDLSLSQVNAEKVDTVLPEVSILLKRRLSEVSYEASIAVFPREHFPFAAQAGNNCTFPRLDDFIVAETPVFAAHAPPSLGIGPEIDISWEVPRQLWNSRREYIYGIIPKNTSQEAVSRWEQLGRKLRLDIMVPKTLITDYYCERFTTCTACYDAMKNCVWCREPGRTQCSHYCATQYQRSPDTCPEDRKQCSKNDQTCKLNK